MRQAAINCVDLIINADDFGYFPCVSQGVAEAARAGVVTATGILSNRPDLARQLLWLDDIAGLDLGVHLNLTSGRPLTAQMSEHLAADGGNFPGVFRMAALLLGGRIGIQAVRAEWLAQIENCGDRRLVFLNSHEHIHMLPALFQLARELADFCRIPHLRYVRPEWSGARHGALRALLLQTLQLLNRRRMIARTPLFIGMAASGRLNLPYLQRLFAKLIPGQCYELMCHPGRFQAEQISDPRLMAYHDWRQELQVLMSQDLQDLLARYHIRLIRYPT